MTSDYIHSPYKLPDPLPDILPASPFTVATATDKPPLTPATKAAKMGEFTKVLAGISHGSTVPAALNIRREALRYLSPYARRKKKALPYISPYALTKMKPLPYISPYPPTRPPGNQPQPFMQAASTKRKRQANSRVTATKPSTNASMPEKIAEEHAFHAQLGVFRVMYDNKTDDELGWTYVKEGRFEEG